MGRMAIVLLALIAACATPQPDFSALVRREAAAVVRIGTTTLPAPREYGADPEDEEGLEDFAGRGLGPEGIGPAPTVGSGFVISEDGLIVTNAHLVEGAAPDGVVVRFADRRELKARVLGADAVSDIALIKVEARGLQHVRVGNASRLQPGEWVAAIGSPLGLERSVTAGIVSAVGRTLPEESYLPFIQTDVAINPGNSGGPLFNTRGEVVGVNSVIYSVSGGFMGLSFAVPIDVAMKVVQELRERGKVTRGRLGVRMQELTPELAAALQVPGGSGALLIDVLAGGPADAAGLRSADVVVSFAGRPVGGNTQFMDLIARARPGELVDVEYVRDGRMARTRVLVDETRVPALPRAPERYLADPVGLLVVPLDRARRARAGTDGVLVRQAEGPAQRAGLIPGDIIVSVNGRAVDTPYAFNEALAAAGKGASVALLVQREGARSFLALRLPD
jgi:serine protease Do